jgi:hypothetical protein
MFGNWAIVNTSMIVIDLFEGDISTHDFSEYQNYGGEVKYSTPYENRGIPQLGWRWVNELDKFVE